MTDRTPDEARADSAATADGDAIADNDTGEAGHPIELLAEISPDTHVGVDFDEVDPSTPHAAPSPARPGKLTEHGWVGDGHEME